MLENYTDPDPQETQEWEESIDMVVERAGNDRALFVDRIPANMVERLEIGRSPSAAMDAQGIGGTINIVLKDAYRAQDLTVLLGSVFFDRDHTAKGQGYLSFGHATDRFAFSLDGTLLERYNPKLQLADIIDEEGEPIHKNETNVLDSEETGFRADAEVSLSPNASLRAQVQGFLTDRTETEDASFFSEGEFDEGEFDHAAIQQENIGGSLAFHFENPDGDAFHLEIDHQRMELDNRADFGVFDEEERAVEEFQTDRTEDEETKYESHATFALSQNHRLSLGIDLGLKERHARRQQFAIDEEDELESVDARGMFRIREERIDPYLEIHWNTEGRHQLQTGLRLEKTTLNLRDAGLKSDHTELFPSLHYRIRMTDADIFRLSLARTTKRPDFEELQPFTQRNQPRDGQVTVGNPALEPEFAKGVDLGYEHRFQGQEGIIGVNLFYRAIDQRVETVEIGEDLFQPRNVAGESEAWGLELDLGAPLTGLGIPTVSLYGNVTLLDSRTTDPLTGETRRFNLQSDYVVNLGLLHYLPVLKASYGLNWLTQGDAREVLLTESAQFSYGDDLEFLFEKRWGKRFSLRLAARNLLDDKREEILREFEGLRTEGDPELTSFETEESGLSFTLTLRGVFGQGGK